MGGPVTTQRATFWRRVLTHAMEPTPYVWGGKRPGGLDCSGLVTLSLWEASDGRIDWRDTHNTDRLWAPSPLTLPVDVADLLPGDLAFYWGDNSKGPEDVSHVAVYAGAGVVIGQNWGGPSDTNPAASRAAGKVSSVKPIHYRADLAGFRRLPLD